MAELPARVGRLSTNDKIAMILNCPDDVDDEDMFAMRASEKAMKQRIRRSVLYGSGSRAHLPVVKVMNYHFYFFDNNYDYGSEKEESG